ncbi:MAG: hypothetical protein IJV06_09520 [Bacteroidaceae bacterium]|nr:hypothetical protein [Bacteroidaceae bacterium]
MAALERADSLCCTEPEAATTMLQSMEQTVEKEGEHALRRWQMLCIKAQDKAYKPLTTDSIIKEVVAYFDAHGTIKEQVEAYYYLGRTYQELHDSPEAVRAYLKAIDLSEKNGIPDAVVYRNITSQLAIFYRRQQNPRAAVDIAMKGYRVAKEFGIQDPIDIMDIATAYDGLGLPDSMEYYYRLAGNEILLTESEVKYSDCIGEICDYYSSVGKQDEAYFYLQILNRVPPAHRRPNFNSNKAAYFEAFGPVDSAIYYLMPYITNPVTPYGVRDIARALMDIYAKQGDYKQSCHYARIYAGMVDSIAAMTTMEQARDANNEYKYQRDKEAEAEAYRQANRAREQRTVMLAILFASLAGYLYYRQRMERKLRLREATIRQQSSTIEKQDNELSQKEEELARMIRRALHTAASEHPSKVFDHFQKAASSKTAISTDEEWQNLTVAVEQLYPGFNTAVLQNWPQIKPEELHVVQLLKLGFETPSIMHITGLPKTSVYRKVKEVNTLLGSLLKIEN